MSQTILLTGATDGIGLQAAEKLVKLGHHVLLHGRNPERLAALQARLSALAGAGRTTVYRADLSCIVEVEAMAEAVSRAHPRLDVLINNAGVFAVNPRTTAAGLDVRFVVNTLAPYILTRRLRPVMGASARVVNLSSAAQSPVNLDALAGHVRLSDMAAYSQSKLAITAWTTELARRQGSDGPLLVSVNPGSMLGSKMVRDAFGVAGRSLSIGADIIVKAALDDSFASASGLYFDNDAGRFGPPHPHALDSSRSAALLDVLDGLWDGLSQR